MAFVKAAAAAEIEVGTVRCVEVGGRQIALVNVAGSFYAVDDECPHAGGPLCEGDVEDGRLVCPWHGACFELATGACAEGPTDQPVPTYPVRVVDGAVEVDV